MSQAVAGCWLKEADAPVLNPARGAGEGPTRGLENSGIYNPTNRRLRRWSHPREQPVSQPCWGRTASLAGVAGLPLVQLARVNGAQCPDIGPGSQKMAVNRHTPWLFGARPAASPSQEQDTRLDAGIA